MKSTLLSRWNLMRFLRLGMGAMMLIQAIQLGDKLVGAIGILLLYQALFNKGCCAGSTCAPSNFKNNNNTAEEISFEEIK